MRLFKKKKGGRRSRRRRRKLSGADWVLRGRKNKQVAFLIKESLKERVGELRSWGKRLRSKQAESFLYTHFLWFWALWEQEAGWNYVLVYAILHHLYSHSVYSLSHLHSRYMWFHENTWEGTGSYAWSLYVHTPSVFVALIEKKTLYLKCQPAYNFCFESISMQSVFTWRSMRKCTVLFTKWCKSWVCKLDASHTQQYVGDIAEVV